MNDNFDYGQSADLYPATTAHRSRYSSYRRFATAAQAIQYAVELLPEAFLRGTALEVGDERYEGEAIRKLYLATGYPLNRKGPSSPD
jgi:hypothetical protein